MFGRINEQGSNTSGFTFLSNTSQPTTTQPFSFGFADSDDGDESPLSATTEIDFATTNGASSQTGTTSGGFNFGFTPSQPATTTQTGFNFGTTAETSNSTQSSLVGNSTTQSQTSNFSFGAKTQPPSQLAITSTGFAFGTTQSKQSGLTPFSTANTEPTVRFSFGPTNLYGFITIPKYGGYQSNDFHDLNIEIYDENGLFTTIKTHRIKVGLNDGLLSQLVRACTKKNDMFTLELATSFIPETKFGRIKAIALQHAISSYIESSKVKAEDIFQVMLVMDYFGIPTFQPLVSHLESTFKDSEFCARAYLGSFNNFFSTYSLPQSSSFFSLFRTAFNILVNGKELENRTAIKELNRQLFETQLKKSVTATELPHILSAIEVWILHNFSSLNETLSYQICSVLDNLQINQIQTIVMMIQLLTCNSPQFYFINSISPEWKLKLINKYASCQPVQPQTQSTPIQPQPQPQPPTQQTPPVQPPKQNFNPPPQQYILQTPGKGF
ncbi:nucleoporin nup98 [Naegleria gruberi]|uniref:Nucleoporin nup98 n=1 Tax=Naegleria gruberi TaxID=5762 RepID=D2VV75_NAEGR|nr:nucleoporin nup98 [Naegleria gruberi]EFC39187.1 nucleoporin nup98 [Naegleria gruberi]|eukprot:XP_002671931.1 nucleoporin nup98 [Naegleria gruberi strain NEG-M]